MTKYSNSINDILVAAKKSASMGNIEVDWFIGQLTGILIVAGNDDSVSIEDYQQLADEEIDARREIYRAFMEQ